MSKNYFEISIRGEIKMKIFYGEFTCEKDVFDNFGVEFQDLEFIYAVYNFGNYEGNSHVIFRKDGVLYEVNGGHCSCHGLEGCWEPEETTVLALLYRPNVDNDAKENLKLIYKNLMSFL